MKNCTEYALDITKEIMEDIISKYEIVGDLNQIKIQIHPIISNAIYKRENELLEKERFNNIIKLSRALDDENVKSVIDALNYQLTIKKYV
jgi:hypothetical protein